MSCFSPVQRRFFNKWRGWHVVKTPCGDCLGCLTSKRLQWQFRLEQEFLSCKFSAFLSFTYDDQHLPIIELDNGTTQSFLQKKVLQDLIKRMRYYSSLLYGASFRHYSCGEYGETDGLTHRAHYHVILFTDNQQLRDNLEKICLLSWKFGRIDVTSVSGGTFGYMTMDIMKSFDKSLKKNFIEDEFVLDYCDRLHIQRPFKLMSTKPFIGYAYLESAKFYHKELRNPYVQLMNGVKVSLPEIYKKHLISNSYEKAKLQIKREEELFEDESRRNELARYELSVDYHQLDATGRIRLSIENQSRKQREHSIVRARKARTQT